MKGASGGASHRSEQHVIGYWKNSDPYYDEAENLAQFNVVLLDGKQSL